MQGTLAPIVDRLDPSAFPWASLPGDVAFVDIETSGGTGEVTRVIEIGIVRVSRDGRTRRFESLIDPEGPVVTTFVHGLEPADLEPAPPFADLWPRLAPWLDDAVLIAHNASFERTHLAKELDRLGGTFGAPVLCTLKLARQLLPERSGKGAHSLAGLQELYGLEPSGHEALSDAESLAVVFTRWCATDDRVARLVEELIEPPESPWDWPDLPGPGAEPVPRRTELPVRRGLVRWLLVAATVALGVAALWGYGLLQ
ncbi:MAG: exonuclease domain-containing protein [Myxococcota bacterium]